MRSSLRPQPEAERSIVCAMKNALGEALRSFAKTTTPEEMTRRGVRRVRSLPLSQVSRMIEVALEHALADRSRELPESERRLIVEDAHERLLEMLHARDQLADRREKVAALRAELDDAMALAGVSAAEAAEAAAASTGGPDGRVALLERRIDKLVKALEATEQTLENALGSVDTGFRSGLRRGEGPDDDDPSRREQKLEMMRGVFETNRTLQSPH